MATSMSSSSPAHSSSPSSRSLSSSSSSSIPPLFSAVAGVDVAAVRDLLSVPQPDIHTTHQGFTIVQYLFHLTRDDEARKSKPNPANNSSIQPYENRTRRKQMGHNDEEEEEEKEGIRGAPPKPPLFRATTAAVPSSSSSSQKPSSVSLTPTVKRTHSVSADTKRSSTPSNKSKRNIDPASTVLLPDLEALIADQPLLWSDSLQDILNLLVLHKCSLNLKPEKHKQTWIQCDYQRARQVFYTHLLTALQYTHAHITCVALSHTHIIDDLAHTIRSLSALAKNTSMPTPIQSDDAEQHMYRSQLQALNARIAARQQEVEQENRLCEQERLALYDMKQQDMIQYATHQQADIVHLQQHITHIRKHQRALLRTQKQQQAAMIDMEVEQKKIGEDMEKVIQRVSVLRQHYATMQQHIESLQYRLLMLDRGTHHTEKMLQQFNKQQQASVWVRVVLHGEKLQKVNLLRDNHTQVRVYRSMADGSQSSSSSSAAVLVVIVSVSIAGGGVDGLVFVLVCMITGDGRVLAISFFLFTASILLLILE